MQTRFIRLRRPVFGGRSLRRRPLAVARGVRGVKATGLHVDGGPERLLTGTRPGPLTWRRMTFIASTSAESVTSADIAMPTS